MNEREIKMSEEIKRLEKELRKYKWTKENPMLKATKDFHIEFYFKEINLGREDNRILRPSPHVKINGKIIPVFRLAKLYTLAEA